MRGHSGAVDASTCTSSDLQPFELRLQEEERPEHDDDENTGALPGLHYTAGVERESILANVLGRSVELGTPERRKSEVPQNLFRENDDDNDIEFAPRATLVQSSAVVSPVKPVPGAGSSYAVARALAMSEHSNTNVQKTRKLKIKVTKKNKYS